MKTVPILFFSIVFIISGIILYRLLTANPSIGSASNYSNPTKIPLAVSSIEIPEPIPTITVLPTATPLPTTTTIITPTPSSKVQIIKATYGPPLGFYPSEFTVKAGMPVRLEVYAAENGRGCMGSITIPDFTSNIQYLTKGETNIFEFTPTTTGEYLITCGMGMPHGSITVK